MRVMLAIGQCNRTIKGTVNTSCLYEGTERVMCRGWLLVSNVKFGSPSPKVSVETSYRGIGKSHMVLQNRAMKELRRHLFFTQLRTTSTATRNRDARST